MQREKRSKHNAGPQCSLVSRRDFDNLADFESNRPTRVQHMREGRLELTVSRRRRVRWQKGDALPPLPEQRDGEFPWLVPDRPQTPLQFFFRTDAEPMQLSHALR